MSKMIQIRNVPDELHRQVKARAALSGMSLSDYLLQQLRRSLERPTREEILRRVQNLPPIDSIRPVAEIVRDARDERSEHLAATIGGRHDR